MGIVKDCSETKSLIQAKNPIKKNSKLHAISPHESSQIISDLSLYDLSGNPIDLLQPNDCGWLHIKLKKGSVLYAT